ncbi:MAG: catalase [Candidatus Nitrohelix vancouverensis]|uniref:Catalase n=1 Tax=Candidatus Nitrohelix vancouverensis TaxID=2705534 RepID=A0A7T0C105_9BACT|nr:MAG: catalase [Candidatus Nitrohelix vancouverensis]
MVAIIQGSPVFISAPGKECTDCEDDLRQQKLQEAEATRERSVVDRVSLSATARRLADDSAVSVDEAEGESEGKQGSSPLSTPTEAQLTEEERQVVQELQARDREVRAHEQAHKSAAGPHATGGPTYTYQTGPDGRRYAVGGEVQIDTSPVPNNPEATIRKAQTIRRAATAPANPSAQDRAVAAQASRMEAEARREVQAERAEENNELLEDSNNGEFSPISSASETNPVSSSESSSASGDDGNDLSNPKTPTSIDNRFKPFTASASQITGSLIDIIS